jgi:hypothetical protein
MNKRRFLRRLACVGVALCVVALGFGVTVRLLGPRPGVSQANYNRLRLGMGLTEVAAILGSPPDETIDLRTLPPQIVRDGAFHPEARWMVRWCGQEEYIGVQFGEDERSLTGYCAKRWRPKQAGRTPFDSLRTRFGW